MLRRSFYILIDVLQIIATQVTQISYHICYCQIGATNFDVTCSLITKSLTVSEVIKIFLRHA